MGRFVPDHLAPDALLVEARQGLKMKSPLPVDRCVPPGGTRGAAVSLGGGVQLDLYESGDGRRLKPRLGLVERALQVGGELPGGGFGYGGLIVNEHRWVYDPEGEKAQEETVHPGK